MRPNTKQVVRDHGLLAGQTESNHHSRATEFRVLINGTSIPSGAYEVRANVTRDDYQTVMVVIRGNESTDIQGHSGCVAFGTATSAECTAQSIKPYGGSGYTISYMGGYSRIHGDSYLTASIFGGASIRLRDLYIDGDEVVLEFYNASGSNKTLVVYGSGVAK